MGTQITAESSAHTAHYTCLHFLRVHGIALFSCIFLWSRLVWLSRLSASNRSGVKSDWRGRTKAKVWAWSSLISFRLFLSQSLSSPRLLCVGNYWRSSTVRRFVLQLEHCFEPNHALALYYSSPRRRALSTTSLMFLSERANAGMRRWDTRRLAALEWIGRPPGLGSVRLGQVNRS